MKAKLATQKNKISSFKAQIKGALNLTDLKESERVVFELNAKITGLISDLEKEKMANDKLLMRKDLRIN